jgi:hypothetical protein
MAHIPGHDRSQLLLLPEAVDDYVPADNPVRFIDALDFLPAVKDWMAEAATRPGISRRREGARLNEGGLWPTASLVRRGLGQREPADAAARTSPQAAGQRHCVRHAHRSGPAPAGPRNGCGTWDRSAQPPAPNGRQRCATGPGRRSA